MSSLEMKSLASAETSLKASSSKSYLAIVTLAIVSTSVSPMNGDKPDNLPCVRYVNKSLRLEATLKRNHDHSPCGNGLMDRTIFFANSFD